jgi:hypothetical protein
MRKIIALFGFGLVFNLGMESISQASLSRDYGSLMLMNLEDMNQVAVTALNKSKDQPKEKVVLLEEAMKVLLSRPNMKDNITEKVLPQITSELDAIDKLEFIYEKIVDEAIEGLKKPEAVKNPAHQTTYAIILENTIAELKPKYSEGELTKKLLHKIADAKIEITKEAQNERRLRVMKITKSPSETAQEIIANLEPKTSK